MPYERTGYAPWSLTREAGVESATVDGTIQVPQYVYPNLDTGFIDEKGNWQGRKSDDRDFIGITKGLAIPNTGEFLAPDTNNFPSINMSGFNDLFIAIKTTRAGNYAITAIMGPDTETFANLSPVNAASTLIECTVSDGSDFTDAFQDTSQSLTADKWNIFLIKDRLCCWKLLRFKITNNSGGASDIETAFMRLV